MNFFDIDSPEQKKLKANSPSYDGFNFFGKHDEAEESGFNDLFGKHSDNEHDGNDDNDEPLFLRPILKCGGHFESSISVKPKHEDKTSINQPASSKKVDLKESSLPKDAESRDLRTTKRGNTANEYGPGKVRSRNQLHPKQLENETSPPASTQIIKESGLMALVAKNGRKAEPDVKSLKSPKSTKIEYPLSGSPSPSNNLSGNTVHNMISTGLRDEIVNKVAEKQKEAVNNSSIEANIEPKKSLSAAPASEISQLNASDALHSKGNGCFADERFTQLLALPEYEDLREKLANITAAKASGNFVYQVAASVESLVKCSDRVKSTSLAQYDQAKEKAFCHLETIFSSMKSTMERCHSEQQTKLDEKLAKLSDVLNQIKTNKQELYTYGQLLKSFSVNIEQ